MGYYTRYSLNVTPPELLSDLRKECEGANYTTDERGNSEEPSKWYSHEVDVKEFSAKHPEALIELRGEGEGSGDIWCKYFKNGKMQREDAQIVVGKYEESKLI